MSQEIDPLETLPGQLEEIRLRLGDRDREFREWILGRDAELRVRLAEGDRRFGLIESGLAENTAATRRIEANTQDIVEFVVAGKGAFKVLNWIGKLAQPMGYIAVFVGAAIGAWTALKSGGKP